MSSKFSHEIWARNSEDMSVAWPKRRRRTFACECSFTVVNASLTHFKRCYTNKRSNILIQKSKNYYLSHCTNRKKKWKYIFVRASLSKPFDNCCIKTGIDKVVKYVVKHCSKPANSIESERKFHKKHMFLFSIDKSRLEGLEIL